jgi:hypothetical protein
MYLSFSILRFTSGAAPTLTTAGDATIDNESYEIFRMGRTSMDP